VPIFSVFDLTRPRRTTREVIREVNIENLMLRRAEKHKYGYL